MEQEETTVVSDELRERLSIVYGELTEVRNALYEEKTLSSLLQERCQLLGRGLSAVWSLVGEEDRRAILAGLHTPTADGKSAPATSLVELLEGRRAAFNGGEV